MDWPVLGRQPTRADTGGGENSLTQQSGERVTAAFNLLERRPAHLQPSGHLITAEVDGFAESGDRVLDCGGSRHVCTLLGVIKGVNFFATPLTRVLHLEHE